MIEKGTKVTYLQTKGSVSRGMTISAREGTLLEYSESICRIKTKNGRTVWVNTKTVRPADQYNALTDAAQSDLNQYARKHTLKCIEQEES